MFGDGGQDTALMDQASVLGDGRTIKVQMERQVLAVVRTLRCSGTIPAGSQRSQGRTWGAEFGGTAQRVPQGSVFHLHPDLTQLVPKA